MGVPASSTRYTRLAYIYFTIQFHGVRMRLPETRDLFARVLEFPVSRETVIETVGGTELSPPDGESTTIGAVIVRSDVEEFQSADDLYDTLMTVVGARFVGRRYYDDRGAMPTQDDESEVSF